MGWLCSTYRGGERCMPGGNLKEKRPLGRPKSIDERIILRWIFRKWDVGARTGSSWLRIGTGGGLV